MISKIRIPTLCLNKLKQQCQTQRSLASKKDIEKVVQNDASDELKYFMHGRKFAERRDSISREILLYAITFHVEIEC